MQQHVIQGVQVELRVVGRSVSRFHGKRGVFAKSQIIFKNVIALVSLLKKPPTFVIDSIFPNSHCGLKREPESQKKNQKQGFMELPRLFFIFD